MPTAKMTKDEKENLIVGGIVGTVCGGFIAFILLCMMMGPVFEELDKLKGDCVNQGYASFEPDSAGKPEFILRKPFEGEKNDPS